MGACMDDMGKFIIYQITSLRMIPTMAYIATYSTALERNI
jgi:hypothetical protein